MIGDVQLILQRGSAVLAAEATGLAFLRVVLPSTTGHLPFAARGIASSSARVAATESEKRAEKKAAETAEREMVAADEEFSAITDKIPQRPITVVEGTSYTVVIIAALGFAAAVIYAALNELIFSPKEYQCYTHTLNRIKDDPRITVRLGSPISAYGTESRNRAARQRIPHRVYNDSEGREHVQLQFHMRGPSGRATVNADMYKDGSEWRYHFLYLNVESPIQQQVVLVRPGQVDEY
ncbi:putative mitochondrial import inner membrane translocase subunit TIM21 [Nannochloris sp. 'desiccata']|nr:hypothetical protein KSW81_003811 [Chlorella desiccata (nom. nud.)]KAH7624309.1 putative mitochondrial import inner membrane translocase subunit TIM21 [Chlorella desiccata (nom. nud.)]